MLESGKSPLTQPSPLWGEDKACPERDEGESGKAVTNLNALVLIASKGIGSLDPAVLNAEIGALKIFCHVHQADQHRYLYERPDDGGEGCP